MSLPAVTVEIAFDSGFATPEDDRTWTDVSEWVEGEEEISISYGRSDELSVPDPNTCSVTLDNRDGRFTPGKSSSPYFPDVKKGKPLRVTVAYDEGVNLLGANQSSFESSAADWVAGGSVVPTLDQDDTHVHDGSQAMLVTWGTGGTLPLAQTTMTGLTVGTAYRVEGWVWVPTGSPAVGLVVAANKVGASTTAKDTWARVSVTFVASATSELLQVWPASAPTSGDQVWVDDLSLLPASIRFTGYIDSWPLVWPDGTESASTVTISASSRRARLGQTAPLTSAIRAAYLASNPDAFWPLTEGFANTAGITVFRDITNTPVNNKATQSLGGFYTDVRYAPNLLESATLPGPTDEGRMVKIPWTPPSVVTYNSRYIGASGAMNLNINPPTDFWGECVVRIRPVDPPGTDAVDTVVFRLGSAGLRQEVYCFIYDNTQAGGGKFVGLNAVIRDQDGTIVEQPSWFTLVDDSNALYDLVTDGEMHHWMLYVFESNLCNLYIDGEHVAYSFLAGTFTERFTSVAIGNITRYADMWASHMAVYATVPSIDDLTSHVAAALAANETPEQRVVRVAGRIGVPADEVDVEASVGDLGAQPEAGRSAVEVLDEAATSTGAILYDTREGHLAMQARSHRYNLDAAFVLSAGGEAQEIQGDLTITDDHRYTINTVEFSRAGSEDVPATVTDEDSVAEYGIFAQSYTVVSENENEVEAFARDRLYRFADPAPRVNQVSIDVANLDVDQRAAVLAADIGTRFGISNLAPQAPADPMYLFFEGATETITATSHVLTSNTTPADLYQNVLILDDPGPRGQFDGENVWAY